MMRWILLLLFLITVSDAQFDSIYTIASSWSMWSAWSTCAPEGVMIRVRACSTVRGFKCVGRNKEFKSCVLQPNRGDEDFDQVDEDRQMAMKQLYQDYDLHGDAASMPKPPQVLPAPVKPKPYLPPGNDVLVVASPGARKPVVPDQETTFKGSFKSIEEEEEPTTVPTMTPLMVTEQVGYSRSVQLETSEELMEDDTEGWATPTTTTRAPQTAATLSSIASKRRYKAKYVTQGPITIVTTTTTTEPPTTIEEVEEEIEVTEEDEMIMETPTTAAEIEEEEEIERPETVRPVMRVYTTTTEATTTTTQPTTTSQSFAIPRDEQEEIPGSVQSIFMGSNRVKIHGRTKLQQLPTVVGEQQKFRPLGMLSPVAPPRQRVHHSGEIDMEEEIHVIKPKRRRMKKLKNKKRIGAVAPSEEFVTGDTARALNWLIANMTNSIGDESPSLTDKVLLEKYTPKETKPDFKWSQWSLWSECRCGLQRRKRICLPTSSELIQESSKCPVPEFEERSCNSNQC